LLILSTHPGVSPQRGNYERYMARLSSWERRQADLSACGYEIAFLCAQSIEEQRRWTLGLPSTFTLLADTGLELAESWPIATIERHGRVAYDELTLVLRGGEVKHVLYASRAPQNDVQTVVELVLSIAAGR
jgi:peroxiredoxin